MGLMSIQQRKQTNQYLLPLSQWEAVSQTQVYQAGVLHSQVVASDICSAVRNTEPPDLNPKTRSQYLGDTGRHNIKP